MHLASYTQGDHYWQFSTTTENLLLARIPKVRFEMRSILAGFLKEKRENKGGRGFGGLGGRSRNLGRGRRQYKFEAKSSYLTACWGGGGLYTCTNCLGICLFLISRGTRTLRRWTRHVMLVRFLPGIPKNNIVCNRTVTVSTVRLLEIRQRV